MRILKIVRVRDISSTAYLEITFAKSFGRSVTKTCITSANKNDGNGAKFYDTGEYLETKLWCIVAKFIESGETEFSPK